MSKNVLFEVLDSVVRVFYHNVSLSPTPFASAAEAMDTCSDAEDDKEGKVSTLRDLREMKDPGIQEWTLGIQVKGKGRN